LQQPYSSTSIWNMPVGTGAQYATVTLNAVDGMSADESVVLMDPTAPQTAIEQGQGSQSGGRCPLGGTTLAMAPIPGGVVVPDSSHNDGFAIVGSDGASLIEGGQFARCTPGAPATADSVNAAGNVYDSGQLGATGGSGLSILGGLLRAGDLAPGTETRHALRLNIDGETDLYRGTKATCFVWPAVRCDGYGPSRYGGSNPALRMGALLAIPQTVSLASLGLKSQAAQELAWTLQNYGAYLVNDSTRPVVTFGTTQGDASFIAQFQQEWGFPFATVGTSTQSSAWAADVQTIIGHLDVVVNNGPASVGGGGAPLQPLAPPLSPPAATSPFTPQNVGEPVAVATPDGGQKLVFWRGTDDNQLYEAWYGEASQRWSGPVDLSTLLGVPSSADLASTPAVAFTPDGGQQLVFWGGRDGDLWEAWYGYRSETWQAQDLSSARRLAGAGTVASAPTVTFTPGGGQQLVFWQGANHDLWEAWYSLRYGTWQSQDLSTGYLRGQGAGTLASAPSVILTPGGGQQLAFWQGSDGHLWEAWYSAEFSAWQVQDLTASHFPSAAGIASQPDVILTPGGGQQLVFYQGVGSGDPWESWYSVGSGAWQSQDLSSTYLGALGSMVSEPETIVTPGGGQQLVFWKANGGQLDEAWYSLTYAIWAGRDLSVSEGLPSSSALASSPSVIVFPNGEQDVFWEGSGATLWELCFASGSWTYHDWSAGA
jgi:hypothetical protein